MKAPPAGFVRLEAGPVVLVAARALEEPLRRLGLLAADGLEQLRATGPPGPSGRAATFQLAVPDEGTLVVRSLRHGGLLGPVLGTLFPGLGRPLRELAVTDALGRRGAPVPRPGFVWGRRRLGPLFEAAVATHLEEGTVDALAFLQEPKDAVRVLRACAALGRTVRRFHDAGGRHGDLHVKNLLVRESPAGVEGVVIDLDKARLTPGLTPGERMAQLMRLFRSLRKRGVLERVGPRGCARFFSAYCGDDRLLRRALWRRVDHELRLVALHAWRRYPSPARDGAGG